MSTSPELSIVLPCFNEGPRITQSLAILASWFGDGAEMLVVDDGSSDDTLEQAQRYASMRPNVRVYRLTENGGKGAAIRKAIPLTRGRHVVLMDADLAYDRDSVQRAIDGLAHADMVIGNRRHRGSHYSVPVQLFGFLYRRHIVGLTFNLFVRALLQIGIRDTQCGLKAFRRDALDRIAACLTIEGFALDVEMLLIAQALGLRISDVPVRVAYESARSSVALLRSGIMMAVEIFRIARRRAAGRYRPARVRAIAARARSTAEFPRQRESVR